MRTLLKKPQILICTAYCTAVSSQFDNSVFLTILDPIKELEGAPQKP